MRLLRAGPVLAPAGVALLMMALRMDPVGHAAAIIQFPLVALGFACLLVAALSPRLPLARFALPGARQLALLAFSLYLTHRQVYAWLDAHAAGLDDWPRLAAFCVYNLAALAVAALLYAGVEKPALALRERLLGRRQKQPGLAALQER